MPKDDAPIQETMSREDFFAAYERALAEAEKTPVLFVRRPRVDDMPPEVQRVLEHPDYLKPNPAILRLAEELMRGDSGSDYGITSNH